MFDLASRWGNSFGVPIISHSQGLQAPPRKEDFDSAPGNAIERANANGRRKSGERRRGRRGRRRNVTDASEHPPAIVDGRPPWFPREKRYRDYWPLPVGHTSISIFTSPLDFYSSCAVLMKTHVAILVLRQNRGKEYISFLHESWIIATYMLNLKCNN